MAKSTTTPSSPSSRKLKILSANACVLASGLRNEKLPCLTISSGISCCIILFLILIILLFSTILFDHEFMLFEINYYNIISIIIPISILSLFIGQVLAFQVARPVGMIISYITGRHDYKKKRIVCFVKNFFVDYDIVAVQEIYEAIPNCFDAKYPDMLLECAKDYGFHYYAKPDGVSFPSISNTSGLLILSKYPIIYQEHLVFKDQYFGDKYAVNRAMLYTKIKLPNDLNGLFESSHLHFFTCHVCPQMKRLAKGCPKFLIKWGDSTRFNQFKEMKSFVDMNFSNKKELCVIAGDFNADIEFPEANKIDGEKKINLGEGKAKSGKAMSTVINTMDNLKLHNCGGLLATYGYLNTNDGQPTENLLTNTKQRHLLVGDDLIFSNDKCKPLETFYRVPFDVKGEEFSHLSDHRGIALELSNKQKKRD